MISMLPAPASARRHRGRQYRPRPEEIRAITSATRG